MPDINQIAHRDRITLLLVLIVATILRLGEPGVVEFRHDEAMLSLLAQDMVAGGSLPLTGIPSSVGIPNPPISVYVLALPYALSADPLIATLFIAALNVVGVGLLWLIAHRYLGRTTALAAALIYALNPWAIYYSRKIWAQDFHTPFVLLSLLLGLYGFLEGKKWAQIACLPLFLLALQIHFAAWALLPLVLWLVWMGRQQLSWQSLIASGLLGILTFIPFLLGLSQTLAQDPDRLANALTRQQNPLTLSLDALTFTAQLATGLGLETQVAPQQTSQLLVTVPPLSALWLLLGLLTLAGIAVAVWMGRILAPLWLLWLGLPILVFTPTWTPIYPHYFIASIPVLCLLAGIGVGFLAEHLPGKPFSQTLVLVGLVGILLSQAIWWRGLLRYLDTTFTPGGFGPPLHDLLAVRDALSPFEDVLILTDGLDIRYDQEPAIWSSLLRRSATCVRALGGNSRAVFPAGLFVAVIAPNAPNSPVINYYRHSDEHTFDLRPGEGAYHLNTFEQPLPWSDATLTPIAPVTFASGASLIGYSLSSERIDLVWQLPGHVDEDYHYFAHFLNSNGDKLAQHDSLLWPGRYWCAGDRLITWSDIDLLPGVTTLRVGLYTLTNSGFSNNPVLDSAGNSAGMWLDIPVYNEIE